jgi:hypothetical protein
MRKTLLSTCTVITCIIVGMAHCRSSLYLGCWVKMLSTIFVSNGPNPLHENIFKVKLWWFYWHLTTRLYLKIFYCVFTITLYMVNHIHVMYVQRIFRNITSLHMYLERFSMRIFCLIFQRSLTFVCCMVKEMVHLAHCRSSLYLGCWVKMLSTIFVSNGPFPSPYNTQRSVFLMGFVLLDL